MHFYEWLVAILVGGTDWGFIFKDFYLFIMCFLAVGWIFNKCEYYQGDVFVLCSKPVKNKVFLGFNFLAKHLKSSFI